MARASTASTSPIVQIRDDIQSAGKALLNLVAESTFGNQDAKTAGMLMAQADVQTRYDFPNLAIPLAVAAAGCVASKKHKKAGGQYVQKAFRMAKTAFENGGAKKAKTAFAIMEAMTDLSEMRQGIEHPPSETGLADLWDKAARASIEHKHFDKLDLAITHAGNSRNDELKARAEAVKSVLEGIKSAERRQEAA